MATTLLRRIDRIRFDLPLAVLLGAAAAFAVWAMPADYFGLLPSAPFVPFGKVMLSAAAAVLLGGIGYGAMRYAAALPPSAIWEPDLATAEEEIESQEEAEERVRTRRADRHPDAPTRQPIRASRDLGRPFMDVAPEEQDADTREEGPAFVPWRRPEPETDADAAAEPAADGHDDRDDPFADTSADRDPWLVPAEELPVADEATAAEPAPPAEPAPTDEPEPDAIAAFIPAEDHARVSRPSISSLMERLSNEVERRHGEAPAVAVETRARPRAAASEDLRRALDELNRLAARRA